MALDDDIRILTDVGLFEGFTQEQLRLLAFGAETVRIPEGRELYREGARADCAYVVTAGRIALYREQGDDRLLLGWATPPDLLGEYALIADTRRLTSAAAEIDAEVMRLNRKLFRRILEEYPEAALLLHRRISEEMQAMIARIAALQPRFS